jgi:hypothetical protein
LLLPPVLVLAFVSTGRRSVQQVPHCCQERRRYDERESHSEYVHIPTSVENSVRSGLAERYGCSISASRNAGGLGPKARYGEALQAPQTQSVSLNRTVERRLTSTTLQPPRLPVPGPRKRAFFASFQAFRPARSSVRRPGQILFRALVLVGLVCTSFFAHGHPPGWAVSRDLDYILLRPNCSETER